MLENLITPASPVALSASPVALTKGPSCVRCKIPLERTWGHAQCGQCKRELAAMHAALEYTMFRKRYYTCCTEGASLTWLLANGYAKDIILPYMPNSTTLGQVQGTKVKALVNSS